MLGQRGDAGLELGVETDHDGAAGAGHEHVVLGHEADLGGDDLELHLGGLDALEHVAHGLGRAEHVGLYDELEHLRLVGGDVGEELIDGDVLRRGGGGGDLLLEAELLLLGELLGLAVVFHDLEGRAAVRGAGPADDAHRQGGRGLLDGLALVVVHRADLAPLGAADEGVADL